jgi:hypothetical protein
MPLCVLRPAARHAQVGVTVEYAISSEPNACISSSWIAKSLEIYITTPGNRAGKMKQFQIKNSSVDRVLQTIRERRDCETAARTAPANWRAPTNNQINIRSI